MSKLHFISLFLFASFMLNVIPASASVIVPDDDKPFTVVEKMPQFPGGEAEMNKFISENLEYPEEAHAKKIEGQVTVRFAVSATGKTEDIEVMRGIDPQCDAEVVRVIKAMPNWIPGRLNGRPLAAYFTISIVFRADHEEYHEPVGIPSGTNYSFIFYGVAVKQSDFMEKMKSLPGGSYKMQVKREKIGKNADDVRVVFEVSR